MRIKIGLFGFGRMGKVIAELIQEEKDMVLDYVLEETNFCRKYRNNRRDINLEGIKLTDNIEEVVSAADVLVDFSVPNATVFNINEVARQKKKLVIGTTGFTNDQLQIIHKKAEEIPILLSANMSYGANLLFKLVELTTKILSDYDIEVLEAHHRRKKDAPSGTAKELIRIISEVRNEKKKKTETVHSRQGFIGERREDEVGLFSIRAGDIVGEHIVMYATDGERIELVHRAHTRAAFAKGAVKAAKFIYHQDKARLYSMLDVLGWAE